MNSVEVALMLDDRQTALGKDHRSAWREWLRLSNALNLRSRPTTIGVYTSMHEAAATAHVPPEWQALLAQATGPERELVRILAEHGVEKPVLGHETAGGIPITISWPNRAIALDVEFVEDEKSELVGEGWTLISSDIDEIMTALAADGGPN